MNHKRLILFGTRHWRVSDIPPGIRHSLAVLIRKFQPDVALEEWSATHTEISGLADVCTSMGICWHNIGPPRNQEFVTFDHSEAADFPASVDVNRYGPVPTQEMREEAMCTSIVSAMSSHNVALVVVGVAHLHSMLTKLSKTFEVDGYAYRLEYF